MTFSLRLPLLRLCVVPAILVATLPSARATDVVISRKDDKAVVTIDGELFTEYVFRGHSKPILYPIIGPHGIEMTRNYPMKEDVDNEAHDHPHHKSLWYTHDDVNGVQFWMEYPGNSSKQKPGSIVQKELRIEGPAIISENEWTSPEGKVVCSDTRTITFGTTDVGRFIDYSITLKATGGDVVFGDTKEGSMGIRTHPLLRLQTDEKRGNHTAKGKSINSEGVEGDSDVGQTSQVG